MKLSISNWNQTDFWSQAEIRLPQFDRPAMLRATQEAPVWVHFGAGNIFRGFIARLQQSLLEQGLSDKGIVAADTFDYDIIRKIYRPYDNLTLLVSLMPDGQMKKEIVASVAEGLCADPSDQADMARLQEIFRNSSLQMVSFTITEKGYALTNMKGEFFPYVQADFANGPSRCSHAMSMVTALLYERFQAGAAPIAMCSMDNCSHNGEKLKGSVLTVAHKWQEAGFVPDAFVAWLEDETRVSFPWSMIDKITPRPAPVVLEALQKLGLEEMDPIVTSRNTYIAPFVNAEAPQYLVVEDRFPNGRPPLEKAGVYMTDRDTVNNTERMKVTTWRNRKFC